MKCENLREQFMEAVLSGPEATSVEMREHLRDCVACARELELFQNTMAVLGDWKSPEPSPYFSSRLRVRLREEAAVPANNWLAWMRRPFVAAAAAVLMVVGVGLLEFGHFKPDKNTLATNDGVVRVSPVNDLQYLDKNADLFSEFDALDGQSTTE